MSKFRFFYTGKLGEIFWILRVEAPSKIKYNTTYHKNITNSQNHTFGTRSIGTINYTVVNEHNFQLRELIGIEKKFDWICQKWNLLPSK